MARLDKLLNRLKRHPKSARFNDLVRLLHSVEWVETGGSGSHRRFEPIDGRTYLIVVRPHGGEGYCSPKTTRSVVALVERERERREPEA